MRNATDTLIRYEREAWSIGNDLARGANDADVANDRLFDLLILGAEYCGSGSAAAIGAAYGQGYADGIFRLKA